MALKDIAGTLAGSVVEDTQLDAYGAVFVKGGTGSETFLSSEIAGLYGTLTVYASGEWQYVLDNSGTAAQGLAANVVQHDLFVVTTSDGLGQGVIDIGVTGVNDNASFSGEFVKKLDVTVGTGISGQIDALDPDVGEKGFQAAANIAGAVGLLSISKSGLWQYELLPGQRTAIVDDSKAIVESFAVAATDGTITHITVHVTTNETVAPAIQSVSPADDASGVATGASLNVTFNEPIQRGSGGILLKTAAGTLVATYDAASSQDLRIAGSTLTIDPVTDLFNGTGYVIEFAAGSVKDLAGNGMAANSSYNFSTVQAGVLLQGGAGADHLVGAAAVDIIQAGAGNDLISGLGGDDQIDGGSGLDTAAYSGNLASYVVTNTRQGFSVAGPDGTDSLAGVERLKFADFNVALDVEGNGGQAYRLYQAAFNRAPDIPGLGFQMKALDDGWGLVQIAQNFIDSPEFSATYGALDSPQFVTLLYQNVLHRAPEDAGLAYHVARLESGIPRAGILVGFSESPENQAALIGVIENGMVYTV